MTSFNTATANIQGVSTLVLLLQMGANPTSGWVAKTIPSNTRSFPRCSQTTQLGVKIPSSPFGGGVDSPWNPHKLTDNLLENLSHSKDNFVASMEHQKDVLIESMEQQKDSLVASMGQQKEVLVESMEHQKEQLQHQLMAEFPFHKSTAHATAMAMDDNYDDTNSVLMGGHKPDIIQMAVTSSETTATNGIPSTIAPVVPTTAPEPIALQLLQPSNDAAAAASSSNVMTPSDIGQLVAAMEQQQQQQQFDPHVTNEVSAQFEAVKAAVLDNQLPSDILDGLTNKMGLSPDDDMGIMNLMNPDSVLVSTSQNNVAPPPQDASLPPSPTIADKISSETADFMTSQAMDVPVPAASPDMNDMNQFQSSLPPMSSTTEVVQALQDVTVNAKQQMSETVSSTTMSDKFHFLGNTGNGDSGKVMEVFLGDDSRLPVKDLGKTSTDMLHKLADGMMGSMKSISHNLLQFVDEMIKDTSGRFAASDLLHSAQDSIHKVVNGGIESIMATVNSVGDVTIRDMVTSLVSLVTLVVKVLFQLVSTLVAAVSGKGIATWVDQTNASIHQGAMALQDQAHQFSNDLSHQSLNEMVAMVDSYLHASTTYMADTASTVLKMGELSTSNLAAPLASAIFTEGISSTWNTLSDKF